MGNENKPIILSIVVPVYKDTELIEPFLERLIPIVSDIGSYEVIFCLDPDGKSDTYDKIRSICKQNAHIKLLFFSKRIGQAKATIAGIFNTTGKYCVVMDVDLQDPPELLHEMYKKIQEGYNVVYAKRIAREGEIFLRRLITPIFYWFINKISIVPIPRNVGDFRMLDRYVIDALRALPEQHAFLKGLIAFIGYKQEAIEFVRKPRQLGTTHYPMIGSLKVALNGIIGYSAFPLTFILWLGFIIALIAIILAIVFAFFVIFSQDQYPLGLPTVTILVLLSLGIQMFSIGIVGEYISRIYLQVLQRPRYIIQEDVNFDCKIEHIDPYIK